MLTWFADPVVSTSIRKSLGWSRLVVLVPIVMIESGNGSRYLLPRLALYAFCFALPQAVALFFEMEHDGRLTLMRLAGRSTRALAARTLLGSTLPWLLAGAVLLGAAAGADRIDARGLAAIAAIAGFTSVSAMVMLVAPGAARWIDARIAVVALCVIAFLGAVLGGGALDSDSQFSPQVAAAVAGIEAVLFVALITRVPSAIVRPPEGGQVPPSIQILRTRSMRWPGFYRGLALGSPGLFLFAITGPLILLIRFWVRAGDEGRMNASTAIAFVPLIIAVFAISWICREDAVMRRLDILRQSTRSAWRIAFESIAGLWTPFVLATAAGLILTSALLGRPPDLDVLPGVFYALLLALPVPMMEGWQGMLPMTFTIPVLAASVISIGLVGLPGVILVSITVWLAAARMFSHDDFVLPSPAGVVIYGLFALSPLWLEGPLQVPDPSRIFAALTAGLYIGVVVVALSPLLIPHRSAGQAPPWLQPAAIGFIAFATAWWRVGPLHAATIAAIGTFAWIQADRIRQFDRSAVTQATVRVSIFGSTGLTMNLFTGTESYNEYVVALTVIAVASATVEVMMFWSRRLRQRGAIPPT